MLDAPLDASAAPMISGEPGAEPMLPAVPAPKPPPTNDSALINEFSSMVQAPPFLISAFNQMTKDRTYVAKDAMMVGTQDTVAVNHVLRNQSVMLAYLGVVDPQPFCQPARQVGGFVDQTQTFLAETMEIWLSHHLHLMRFADRLEGACQDASTNGYAIIKVSLQDDLMRDAIGESRFGDMQEQVAEFLRLKDHVDAGLCVEGHADYTRFKDLDQTLRLYAAGKIEEEILAVPVLVPGDVPMVDPATGSPVVDPMTGEPLTQPGMMLDPMDPRETKRQAIINGEAFDILGMPQLPHYRGFVSDQILPEDFRWSWDVTRIEDLPYAQWWAHRVDMHPQAAQRKWRLTAPEMQAIAGGNAGNLGRSVGGPNASSTIEPGDRTQLEGQSHNDRVAVWEVWHAGTRRRYVFIEGMNRFLVNELPQWPGRRFSPFFAIGYNRVTGQVMPVGDVQLVRQLQDQINQTMSHDREYRRAAYPVLFIPKGTLDPAAMKLYRERVPFSVIETSSADEIKKYLQESTQIPYNRELCDTSKSESLLQQMFGIPMMVTGGDSGGESLASAVALQKEGMETGVLRRRVQTNRVVTDILEWMAEVSLKVFGIKDVQKVCGLAAVWPRLTADQLYTNIRIEVKGGLSGQPRAKERIDLWINFANIAQSLGLPVNGIEILRELLDALGIRTDFKRFLVPVAIPGTVPGAGGEAAPGGTGEQVEPANKGAGPDGGAPTMTERGAPDNLSEVPNHPPSVPNVAA